MNVQLVNCADGREAFVVFGTSQVAVRPDEIAVVDGVLRLVLPLDIEAPSDCVEVVRHLPPEPEQLRLAVEALPLDVLDRLLLRESALGGDDSWPLIVKRAVGYALAGDRGEDG